jgi:S1-C subfamily serine protease
MNNLLQQLNDDLTANVEKARRSLVEIRNGHGGAGAGIVVRADGLVITNAHVVGRRGLKLTLPDGRALPARLIAYDRDHDLAALGWTRAMCQPSNWAIQKIFDRGNG